MKKATICLFAIVAVLSACNKQDELRSKTSITVEIDNMATKTDLAGTVNIMWSAGDEISVTTTTGFKTFALEGAGGSNTGTFSIAEDVEVSTSALSFYPASMFPNWQGDEKCHVTLPDNYTWTASGIQAPMYAWLNQSWDKFALLTSVLKVDIYNIPATADKLVFTTKNEKVSGDFAFNSACLTNETPAASGKTITIGFTAGEASTRSFYIPIPQGTYTAGASIQIMNGETELLKKTIPSSITIAASSITYLPPINCVASGSLTNVWTGSHDVQHYSSTTFASGGITCSKGGILRFTFSLDNTVGGESNTYWQLWFGYNTPWTEILTFGIPSGISQCDLILDETQAANLTSHTEWAISGHGVTLTQVDYIPAKAETILWTGSVDFGNWANNFNEAGLNSAAIWSNLSTGKQLSIYYTPSASSGELHIKTASGWTDITGLSTNTASGSNHITFTLTSTQVEAIQTAGIVMQGSNITITKVTLR